MSRSKGRATIARWFKWCVCIVVVMVLPVAAAYLLHDSELWVMSSRLDALPTPEFHSNEELNEHRSKHHPGY